MKKTLCIFVITVILVCILCACDNVTYNEDTDSDVVTVPQARFYQIRYSNKTKVIIDVETRVQYLYHDSGYDGGMTVLLDQDGKPLLYEGELVDENGNVILD